MILSDRSQFGMKNQTYESDPIQVPNRADILERTPSLSVDIYNRSGGDPGVWTSATCGC